MTSPNPPPPAETWSIRRLVAWATEDFRNRGFDSPRLDAELLLGVALHKTRIEIILQGDRPLDKPELDSFRELVRRRRAGEPTAYILGTREFYGTILEVDSNVLVPRPDTECLVEVALQRTKAREVPSETADDGLAGGLASDSTNGAAAEFEDAPPVNSLGGPTDRSTGEKAEGSAGISAHEAAAVPPGAALDLCTGSGCVGIAFALARRNWSVTCVDLSPGAIEVAKRNAARTGLTTGISFVVGDLFAPLPSGASFELITANPPYIPTDVIATLDVGIRSFEPRMALDGGPDGLVVTRRLIAEAPGRLNDDGILAVEIGWDQGPAVMELMQAAGFADLRVNKDYGGNQRVVSGRKSQR
jgi:release factor glutamine methyltransferase